MTEVMFTKVESEALSDMIYYATQNCMFDEDVALYNSIAEKLDKVVKVEKPDVKKYVTVNIKMEYELDALRFMEGIHFPEAQFIERAKDYCAEDLRSLIRDEDLGTFATINYEERSA